MPKNGWNESAAAWIADMGEHGDFGRRYVLDPIMLPRALAAAPKTALDIGCGEGRFCRMLREHGVSCTGVDPTPALLERARALDPDGAYIEASGGALPVPNASFELVVAYLSLIDMPEIGVPIAEMARVLKPGGSLLLANLNGFSTAAEDRGWVRDENGNPLHYPVDRYLEERAFWTEWRGIRIVNHHRPLSAYMREFMGHGLQLRFFDEPEPIKGAPEPKAGRYRRVPWYVVMEWQKPS